MKKIILFNIICAFAIQAFAQKETYDLISFTPPAGWTKEIKETLIIYSTIDQEKGTWCQVGIIKSTASKGNIHDDFESEWQELVINNYHPTDAPEVNDIIETEGWKIKEGSSGFTFNNENAFAFLTTVSGYNRCASIVISTNSEGYMNQIELLLASVELNIPTVIPAQQTVNDPMNGGTNPVKPSFTSYSFTITNFDNGWTSTVKENWVEASRGNVKALIHYPNQQVDEYNPDMLESLKFAWNTLSAPKYTSIRNLEFKTIHDWQSVKLAEADAIETSTGKNVHIVFFKKNYYGGSGKYIEFITPDKNTFEQEFGSLQASPDWDKLGAVAGYNKFAVAKTDLSGQWTNKFSGTLQYVNVYTGLDAGMSLHASTQNFEFLPGDQYKWDLVVASGMVGEIKFEGVKSAGNFSMTGNWQINFSDIEGKPRIYDVYFSCIKGLRLLWINNESYIKKE